jgi:hypothetical protein
LSPDQLTEAGLLSLRRIRVRKWAEDAVEEVEELLWQLGLKDLLCVVLRAIHHALIQRCAELIVAAYV